MIDYLPYSFSVAPTTPQSARELARLRRSNDGYTQGAIPTKYDPKHWRLLQGVSPGASNAERLHHRTKAHQQKIKFHEARAAQYKTKLKNATYMKKYDTPRNRAYVQGRITSETAAAEKMRAKLLKNAAKLRALRAAGMR